MTTQTYHVRPGRRSDLLVATDLYLASFGHDQLVDILFPSRHDHPQDFKTFLLRLFETRWWTPQYDLAVVCHEDDTPVGFSWWKRPLSQLSFYEKWLSPYAWFAPLVRGMHKIRGWLSPIATEDETASSTFSRVFAAIEPQVINSPRRKDAFYLSTLAIDPKLQGLGLGTKLLLDGLQKADERGAAAWLIGLVGLDRFYTRYGFAEVARANVGELAHWDGGIIMFRE